jgi:hypothetical protein
METKEKHHEPGGENRHKHVETFHYFVDGVEYESHEEHITGAIIKSKLPEAKRGYALFLEGHGKQPDQLINDDTSVTLEKNHPKRFYTVPPASFGTI